jgi:predicted AlkP superfamily phosphohydrolase/phosphomutase
MSKLIVIGIDGATPDLMFPWMDQGMLPNFQRIREGGVSGRLNSVPNQRSAAAWSSFATGTNPGKHGIFEFYERILGTYQIRFTQSSQRDGISFWKYLSEKGKTVIVVNVPMTYPAEEIKGCMISGLDAPSKDSRGFTYPDHLLKEIEEEVGSYVHEPGVNSLVIKGKGKEAFAKIIESVQQRGKAIRYLMKKYGWDTTVAVFRETDPAQHCFWKDMEDNESELDEVVLRVYQEIDREVGKILDSVGRDCKVLILSDHGFGFRQHGSGCLNEWLCEAGLLKFKNPQGKSILSPMLRRSYQLLEKILNRRIKEKLFGLVPDLISKVHSKMFFSEIEWEKTTAYADNCMPVIWINSTDSSPAGRVPREKYWEVVSNVKSMLLGKCLEAKTGRKIVDWVKHREEIYTGAHVGRAPDLLVKWKESERIDGLRFGEAGRPLTPKYPTMEFKVISGDHRPMGVFMAAGEGIKKHCEMDGLNIVDIPATAIYLNELPIPDLLDGKVPRLLFTDEFLDVHPIERGQFEEPLKDRLLSEYSQEEEASIREKLRGLGYLD